MSGRVAFFDSNVLIAASVPNHPHHQASSACLISLRFRNGCCAAHTLAEVYNILTGYPKGYAVPPSEARQIIQEASDAFKIVSLTPTETLRTIHQAAERGIAGRKIFDALLLACARKVDAEHIYTYNLTHFRLIAPDLASRIVHP